MSPHNSGSGHLISIIVPVLLLLSSAQADSKGPLLLSPLIKEGRISEALKLSEVQCLIKDCPSIKSYSGFITVKEHFNTNLFFWFFPASKDWHKAPVIFWSDGGPGATLLNSLFNMHGPYTFDKDKNLVLREEFSWNSEFNIIYLDNPAGVGFSYTDEEAGYAKSGIETAPNIYKFLLQFFQLFPTLRNNDFYNGGASYGGTYAVAIGHYIHKKNKGDSELKIRLKGLIMDSPWIHPMDQIDYGTWLHNSGLISPEQREIFDQKRDEMVALLKEDRIKEASQIWFHTVMLTIMETTGFTPLHDYTSAESMIMLTHNYTDLVTSSKFRDYLHTGRETSFSIYSPKAQLLMKDNFMQSVKPLLEELLNAPENYKMLVYSGNLDVITGHLGVEKVLRGFDLGSKLPSQRIIWKDTDPISMKKSFGVSGYIQNLHKQLWYAMLRNAGHGCSIFQPGKVLDLVKHFVNGDIDKLANNNDNKGKDEL